MSLFDEFTQHLEMERGVGLATLIAGPRDVGSKLLLTRDGIVKDGFRNEALAQAVQSDLKRPLGTGQPETIVYEIDGNEWEVFVEAYPPLPRVLIIGGTDTAIALSGFAKTLGYRVIVTDARAAFARVDRFPEADEVIKGWPQDVLPRLRLDESTYVVLLSHDPKFDEPTLQLALPSTAPYVGAIGSRKTQAERFARLRAEGYTEEQLARIHGPVGLDLGGRSPAEIALAIMAEITAVRYQKAESLDRAASRA